jgi:HAD superfamily hydrolase (TIGR01490 family)
VQSTVTTPTVNPTTHGTRIPEALDGKRIAITGSTGFLGTALVERLLRSVPGCELVLLIRPGKRSSVTSRAHRELFRNDAFDRLRSQLGTSGFDEVVASRVSVVAGDVARDGLGLDDEGRAALSSCDIVVHAAAAVAFDAPLDAAVEVNLLGPCRIASALHDLDAAPHLISVSTCYVAGNRRGSAPEGLVETSPFFVDVDWHAEVMAARRARHDAESTSRSPEMLRRFRKEARQELGAAGVPLLAAKTEQRRQGWVKDRMVASGRARAVSLGWPDAYAYTKALGERALLDQRGVTPITIVRPSIIESALAEPKPGWIRGFRMAEPVIISYARGLLKEFPGVPEGTVDVIPVDLVAAAIIDAASRPMDPGHEPEVIQVASGSLNPLRYRQTVELVRGWFTENPLYDSDGQPIVVPDWSFPGRGRVQRQLERVRSTLERAETALAALPLRGRQAAWSSSLEQRRQDAERALEYVELYGAYAECEATFGVDRLMARWDRLDPRDRDAFCFDPRVIDWNRYMREIHLPSIVDHARVRTSPGQRTAERREDRLRRQVLAPERDFAAFDLENTLIASNVVASYAWLASNRLAPADRLRFVVRTLREAPGLWSLDRRDRGDFLRHFYRRFDHAPIDQLVDDTAEMFSHLLLTKSFPAAIRRVREHKSLGHRTLLITGALDVTIEPLLPLFDDVVCASLHRRSDGTFRGELTDVPPTGESRAQAMIDYAQANDFDLANGVAYADGTSDLPMLEAVGFPVAVNPEARLAALARKRGWLVEHWSKARGGREPLLPLAPGPRGNGDDAITRLLQALSGDATGNGVRRAIHSKVEPPR